MPNWRSSVSSRYSEHNVYTSNIPSEGFQRVRCTGQKAQAARNREISNSLENNDNVHAAINHKRDTMGVLKAACLQKHCTSTMHEIDTATVPHHVEITQ
jgi:hypothetical protein